MVLRLRGAAPAAGAAAAGVGQRRQDTAPRVWHERASHRAERYRATPLHDPFADARARQTLTADLHALGYRAQLNVDFSPSAIAIMSARHAGLEGVEWRVADVRRMGSVGDGTIDFALDKACSFSLHEAGCRDWVLTLLCMLGHAGRDDLRFVVGSRGRGQGECRRIR